MDSQMNIAANLTTHTIVICVDKKERGIAMETVLSRRGFHVIVTQGLYDGFREVTQQMPHLVITEAVLHDGTAGAMYDRLQQHQTLNRTPVMVHVLRKSKEELAPLASRQFASFLLGPLEPRRLIDKVAKVIQQYGGVSPYFTEAATAGLTADSPINIEASAVGRIRNRLVLKSTTEVDTASSMLCVPRSGDLSPATLHSASNLRQGDDTFNLFPLNRIVGLGRQWVMNLPEIQFSKQVKEPSRRVVFFDPDEQRFNAFAEILKGYDIDLIHAKNLDMVAMILSKGAADIGAVYLHKLVSDVAGSNFKNVYLKLNSAERPPVLVGTTATRPKSTSVMRYLPRPFGLGTFVEALEAAFERCGPLVEVTGRNSMGIGHGVAVSLQATAKLLGIDETGGILELRFPLLKGSILRIDHQFLQSVWGESSAVRITGAAQVEGQEGSYQARFEAVEAGTSKVKYWDRLTQALVQHTASNPSGPKSPTDKNPSKPG